MSKVNVTDEIVRAYKGEWFATYGADDSIKAVIAAAIEVYERDRQKPLKKLPEYVRKGLHRSNFNFEDDFILAALNAFIAGPPAPAEAKAERDLCVCGHGRDWHCGIGSCEVESYCDWHEFRPAPSDAKPADPQPKPIDGMPFQAIEGRIRAMIKRSDSRPYVTLGTEILELISELRKGAGK